MAGGKAEARPDEPTGEKCPDCGHALVKRHGRFGAYVSCSNYPACRYKPPKPVRDTGVACPKDGGVIAERRGRFRPFYGCVNYPNCDFTLSARPIPQACPQCANPYLLVRDRKGGAVFACDKAGCGFEKPAGAIPEMRDVFLPPSAAPPKPSRKRKPADASLEAEAPPAPAVEVQKAGRSRKATARRRAS